VQLLLWLLPLLPLLGMLLIPDPLLAMRLLRPKYVGELLLLLVSLPVLSGRRCMPACLALIGDHTLLLLLDLRGHVLPLPILWHWTVESPRCCIVMCSLHLLPCQHRLLWCGNDWRVVLPLALLLH
jgi:hypothetical protein